MFSYTVLQFPKDTLDAAFDIVEQSTEKEGNLAFQALVHTSTTLVCVTVQNHCMLYLCSEYVVKCIYVHMQFIMYCAVKHW